MRGPAEAERIRSDRRSVLARGMLAEAERHERRGAAREIRASGIRRARTTYVL